MELGALDSLTKQSQRVVLMVWTMMLGKQFALANAITA
jgi:hypothetical protein